MSLLRSFLEELFNRNEAEEVSTRLSVNVEVTRYILSTSVKKTIVFKNIIGYENFRVLSNLVSTREKFLLALGINDSINLFSSLISSCERPLKPKEVESAEFMENVSFSLNDIPILKYFKNDGGKYITSGIIIAKDPELEFQNASFHRMMLLDDRHLVVRIVPRHLHRIYSKYKRKGLDTPVAIVIGVHPAILLAAASSPRYGIDELHVANRLTNDKVRTVYMQDVELFVPHDAEIVILGRILHDKYAEEGPFVDITGTYDIIRRQPVIEINKILFRTNALYHAIVPASAEHRSLMGLYREALIWRYVSNIVPSVKDVVLTNGGCGWLHCVISIKKEREGDAKNVILAAFAAHPSLKAVVVVDDDIDARNPTEVEWAIATRYQPAEDTIILSGVRGSSLDPSSNQEKLLTSKIGIDATRPLDKDYKVFKRVTIDE